MALHGLAGEFLQGAPGTGHFTWSMGVLSPPLIDSSLSICIPCATVHIQFA